MIGRGLRSLIFIALVGFGVSGCASLSSRRIVATAAYLPSDLGGRSWKIVVFNDGDATLLVNDRYDSRRRLDSASMQSLLRTLGSKRIRNLPSFISNPSVRSDAAMLLLTFYEADEVREIRLYDPDVTSGEAADSFRQVWARFEKLIREVPPK
jgi:hypothetical protein